MEHQNTINFFWSGDNWTYLHDMTIKSHIKVGHKVVIWLHGAEPKSKWWDVNGIELREADDIISITNFMKRGGNFKTASSLWRFTFLHKYGGWYSDTDAVAVKRWPDQKWVITNDDKGLIPTGVLKVPPGEDMFLDMIQNLKYDWGNVQVFTRSYRKFKRSGNPTIVSRLFFPFEWTEWEELLQEPSGQYMDIYSVHLYHTMFERAGMIDTIDQWCKDNPKTLLGKLDGWARSTS